VTSGKNQSDNRPHKIFFNRTIDRVWNERVFPIHSQSPSFSIAIRLKKIKTDPLGEHRPGPSITGAGGPLHHDHYLRETHLSRYKPRPQNRPCFHELPGKNPN
jgi:hypothetical protein